MKTKMFKKLIAAVCALTMATSCSVMSVGASPIIPVNWTQSYYAALNIMDHIHEVGDNGRSFEDCIALANELEEFFNGPACNVILKDLSPDERGVFIARFNLTLFNLRSHNLERRELGTGAAIDQLGDVEGKIIERIHQ